MRPYLALTSLARWHKGSFIAIAPSSTNTVASAKLPFSRVSLCALHVLLILLPTSKYRISPCPLHLTLLSTHSEQTFGHYLSHHPQPLRLGCVSKSISTNSGADSFSKAFVTTVLRVSASAFCHKISVSSKSSISYFKTYRFWRRRLAGVFFLNQPPFCTSDDITLLFRENSILSSWWGHHLQAGGSLSIDVNPNLSWCLNGEVHLTFTGMLLFQSFITRTIVISSIAC